MSSRLLRARSLSLCMVCGLAIVVDLSGNRPVHSVQAYETGFLTIGNDQRLNLNGTLFDLPSTNMFDLLHLYIFDPASGLEKLSRARSAGFRVVRFFSGGLYGVNGVPEFPAIEVWENDPMTHAQYFSGFDQLISDAQSLDVTLIPMLVTGSADLTEVERPTGEACREFPFSLPFLPGSENRAAMKGFALSIVTRYRESETVLFWEITGEANLHAKHRNPELLCVTKEEIAAWIQEMAMAIKAIDPNHLVAAGVMQEGEDPTLRLDDLPGAFNDYGDYFRLYNDLLGVDLATVHIYDQYKYLDAAGQSANIADFLRYFLTTAHGMGRPLWIGEFGVPPGQAWSTNNFHDFVMSLLLAKHYLSIDLATVWNWESKQYETVGPEFVQFSIDSVEDDDIIGVLTDQPTRMGRDRGTLSWIPLVGDFDNDSRDDLLAVSNRGLWHVSLLASAPTIPAQWLSIFGDNTLDPGAAPFRPLVGDWNGDGRMDVGAKARDGRWYVAFSDGRRFTSQALWLSNFGDDNADAGAPFLPLTGDWDGDGRADIGAKTTDGRWYVAFSNGAGFGFGAHWLSGFGNDYADPGGAPFVPLTGDWNGDGKTDVGVKSKDGRWYIAFNTGTGFGSIALALSGFGNDYADPGGAPFLPLVGDWNNDGRSDIGAKSRDGRWYVAFSDGAQFVGMALALSNFGNDTLDGGSPFVPFTGDWNADGRTDIGAQTTDGRWYIALSDGGLFVNPAYWH